MLTKKQTKLLDSLSVETQHVAPNLAELAEELTTAFGGTRALAQLLRDIANDPKKPDWLRTRACGMVVNTISAASKLEQSRGQVDVELLSDEDLKQEAIGIMRGALGIGDGMDAELTTVVTTWPELSATARASILAMIGAEGCSPPIDNAQESENDIEATDSIKAG
jgi:hypothetical protein